MTIALPFTMARAKSVFITAVVVVIVWCGLNVVKMMYYDWRFLHQARLVNDQLEAIRAAQQAQPQPPPPAPAPH